ncbi:hypothetical protein BGZ91_011931 [Linnemannia elongata]|nr:hypothetical protein BGZ91_011931 [Linnemannia elongata]
MTLFNDLPHELQETIASFLTQYDLCQCIRVCQTWRALFHPYLWKNVRILWSSADCHNERTLTQIETHGHLIHSLQLNCEDSLLYFDDICPEPFFPFLTSLEISGPFYDRCDEFVGIIKRGSPGGWRKLVFSIDAFLDYSCHFKQDFFDAVIQHGASTLEILRLEGRCNTYSTDIHRLLCAAPRLKELRFTKSCTTYRGGYLSALDLASSSEDWVCSGLEVFVCQIGGIQRPDFAEHFDDLPERLPIYCHVTLQESIDLQRKVYTRLARLTELRELILGYDDITVDNYASGPDDKEYTRQTDCLAMTVESGLDLLKGLKELRLVGLEDMAVWVKGEEEQSWFLEHWPNAEILSTPFCIDLYRERW